MSFKVKPLRAKSSAVIDCRDILVLYRLRYSDWMVFSLERACAKMMLAITALETA